MSERIVHDLIQGTPLWDQFRLDHDGASEAAPMLGISSKMTRSELLRAKATGIAKEYSDFMQEKIFARGHELEAQARPIAEKILGEDLYPTTCSLGKLSASCDGLTMDETTAWEHKQWAKDLAASVAKGILPEEHQPQCQQVMMVTGAEQVLFMVSDGTPENCVHMMVKPDPAWAKRIREGWAQFEADLLDYKPVEVIPAAKAAATIALPALSIQVAGSITLHDNLKLFGEKLTDFIAGLPEKPSTDQEFADSEAAIKTLETAEKALEAAKANALAQVATVDEMSRTVALYAGQARQTRLALTALVKARKESIRVEIVQGGKDALGAHLAMLNKRIGRSYMLGAVSMPDFAGAIKGKKTVSSLRDAVDTMLASGKIEANSIADKAEINLKSANSLAKDYTFLFRDMDALLHMDSEAFDAIVINRVRAHQDAEKERLETEREKIRAEEAAKAKAEAERAERVRVDQESRSRQLAEDEAKAKVADAEASRQAQERAKRDAEDKARREAIQAEEAAARDRIAAEEARLKAESDRLEAARIQQEGIERAAKAKADEEERQKRLAEQARQETERVRQQAIREAEERKAHEAMLTEEMITTLRARIERSKPHDGIARAIDAYLGKAKEA